MSDFATMPAEKHVKIKAGWWTKNKDKIFYIYQKIQGRSNTHKTPGFSPRGILLSSNKDDSTATTAIVRGFLTGESTRDEDTWTLALNVIHPLRFAAIYEDGTTARGIKILG